jgi:hypothetical protein
MQSFPLASAVRVKMVIATIYLFLMFSRLLGVRGLLSLPSRFFGPQVFDLILE